jgi:hypothetical protein
VTSPRDVRFTPNNGRWTGHPSQHLAVGLKTPRDEGVPITVVSFTLLLRLLLGAKMPLVTLARANRFRAASALDSGVSKVCGATADLGWTFRLDPPLLIWL